MLQQVVQRVFRIGALSRSIDGFALQIRHGLNRLTLFQDIRTPKVFSANSLTPPSVLLYSDTATLVGTAAISTEPEANADAISSGAAAMENSYLFSVLPSLAS